MPPRAPAPWAMPPVESRRPERPLRTLASGGPGEGNLGNRLSSTASLKLDDAPAIQAVPPLRRGRHAAARQDDRGAGERSVMPKRVLLIDDEAPVHDLVTAFLEPAGYEVLAADRGEPGLHLAASEAPDLILLDLALPDMDGYEICRALRHNETTKAVPIVMLTGSDDPTLTRRAFAAGAQACVLKPFRREALIAVIQAVKGASPRQDPEHGAART